MLVNKICEHLSLRIENGELSNTDMVQIIEHIGAYLNIATVPNYAKQNNMSYNGVKKYRHVKKIFNVKFVIDNE
ncbi:hypothetical protein ESA94_20340 [Lacibacter luteus]|uniref:Uncharacterized protein n=1 Tax=Lacibacter luteus TaxID=2508719 RepID=A0A4V1M6Z7_9BACT|nr:hypothetical protein [Lacibacter luteus]RXK57550.1 hypothetical protein ESA94_20340 [Lacibacter luteus]